MGAVMARAIKSRCMTSPVELEAAEAAAEAAATTSPMTCPMGAVMETTTRPMTCRMAAAKATPSRLMTCQSEAAMETTCHPTCSVEAVKAAAERAPSHIWPGM